MVSFPAVLVTGARQTGKTTLLRTEFGASHDYVSLERPDIRNRALADPVGFFAQTSGPLILDEIQYAPELLHYIKELIDARRKPGQWLLTGSQSFSLMQGVSQTLAGRVAVLNLDPLSARELSRQPQISPEDMLEWMFRSAEKHIPAKASGMSDPVDTADAESFRNDSKQVAGPSFEDWLLRGGFPEPCLNKQVDRQLWFSGYLQTYIQRDVRDLTQVSDLENFLQVPGAGRHPYRTTPEHDGAWKRNRHCRTYGKALVIRAEDQSADLSAAALSQELRQTAKEKSQAVSA